MNTITKRTISIVMFAFMLAAVFAAISCENTYAAIKLSKKSIIIGVGQSVTLKVKGTKSKVKWSSTNKSVATVSKKGVVKGKSIGSCYIKAKVAGKTLKCKVAVKKPVVANAMNLRKYILAHGKKGIWGGRTGYAIGYRDGESGDPYNKVARVCVYAKTTEMYFELRETRDDEWSTLKMNMDIIKEKTGTISYYDDAEYFGGDEYNSVTAEIDTSFDGTLDSLINVTVNNYVYNADSIKSDAVECVNTGFRFFDNAFAKAKLKSRMRTLGFSNWDV